jgi:hypothetical protein
VPLALGAAWFAAAMKLIARFSEAGGYKYGIYYAWLGNTPWQMLVGAVTHPLRLLLHVFTFANLEMALGFLMPLMLLPLLRPKRLVLLIGPLLQIILGAPGGGELIIQTHYASLFLPALFLAAIDGFGALPPLIQKFKGVFDKDEARRLAYGALIIGAAYGALVLGPLPSVAAHAFSDGNGYRRAENAAKLVAMVPPRAGVAASYAFLPALSSREKLTSLHYAFLGVTQFGERPFTPPEDTEYAVLDNDDLLAYRTQFTGTAWAAPHYAGGNARLKKVASAWTTYATPFVLYQKGVTTPNELLPPLDTDVIGAPPFPFLGNGRAQVIRAKDGVFLEVYAYWQLHGVSPDDLVVRARIHPRGLPVAEQLTLLDGIDPASFAYDAEYGEYVTYLRIPLPSNASNDGTVQIGLERQKAVYELDGLRSPHRRVTKVDPLDLAFLPIQPFLTDK